MKIVSFIERCYDGNLAQVSVGTRSAHYPKPESSRVYSSCGKSSRPALDARRKTASSLQTTVQCPTLVPSGPNLLRSVAFAQPKTRFGRGSPNSLLKIWPSEWETLAISGKNRIKAGLTSLQTGAETERPEVSSRAAILLSGFAACDKPSLKEAT